LKKKLLLLGILFLVLVSFASARNNVIPIFIGGGNSSSSSEGIILNITIPSVNVYEKNVNLTPTQIFGANVTPIELIHTNGGNEIIDITGITYIMRYNGQTYRSSGTINCVIREVGTNNTIQGGCPDSSYMNMSTNFIIRSQLTITAALRSFNNSIEYKITTANSYNPSYGNSTLELYISYRLIPFNNSNTIYTIIGAIYNTTYNITNNITNSITNNITNIYNYTTNLAGYFNHIDNFTGTKTNNKICTWDDGTSKIICDYTDQIGGEEIIYVNTTNNITNNITTYVNTTNNITNNITTYVNTTNNITNNITSTTSLVSIYFWHTVFNPADGTTYHFSNTDKAPTTSGAGYRKIYIPFNGTIKYIELVQNTGNTGFSSGNLNYSISTNGGTETIFRQISGTTYVTVISNRTMNYNVSTGDYLTIRVQTPTWVTNPTDVTWTGNVFIETT
jgi:hypothetical protein